MDAAEVPPHIGPRQDEMTRRERFAAQELGIVLSHYDLGVIYSISEYPRGSRRSPKVRIRAQRGEFLLKRRAPGRDLPDRVAFCHHLQLHLASRGFPVPAIIGTREDNNSMVQLNGRVYEMFEYMRGTHYDGSKRGAQYSGYTLARLHNLLQYHEAPFDAPSGSYHESPGMEQRAQMAAEAIRQAEPMIDARRIKATCAFLGDAYADAASRVRTLGFADLNTFVVHGDWHPGNLLYEGFKVQGVIDFDSARREPRVVDVANGVLQFSMEITKADDPSTWPDGLNAGRLRAFLVGYDQHGAGPLTDQEYESVPWLIVEALIAESITPIAATGRFARIPGSVFLEMVERKVRWIQPRANRVIEFARNKSA